MKRTLSLLTFICVTFSFATARTHKGLAYVDLGLPSGTKDYFAWCETKPNAGLSVRFVEETKQEQQKPKSLVGTKWKWEEKWEWPEEWGENLYDSDYYTVYEYFEFISENKLYHESDFGLLGGDANYYHYTFDGYRGAIFFEEERQEILLKTDEKGLKYIFLPGHNSWGDGKFKQVKE